MTEDRRATSEFTYPGDKIAVAEEFIPGAGTYEKDGVIFSELVGHVLKDKLNKTIMVKPASHQPLIPKEGSIVIGVVTSYQERMASVDLFMIDGRVIYPSYGAILHISNSSRKYERGMNDVCKTGDVIRARVINIKNKVPLLSTSEPDLGVIKAYCSQCGEHLKFRSHMLHCTHCNSREVRKVASPYDQDIPRSNA